MLVQEEDNICSKYRHHQSWILTSDWLWPNHNPEVDMYLIYWKIPKVKLWEIRGWNIVHNFSPKFYSDSEA